MITRSLLRPSHSSRRLTARLGWLMVAAVAVWALLGGAGLVGATHTEPIHLTLVAADKECQDAGYDFGWKIDSIDQLHAGPYTFSSPDGSVTGSITFIGDDDPNDPNNNQPTGYTLLAIDPAPAAVFVKQPQEGGGISHITFCYNIAVTPTPTPTPVVTPTPTPVITPTPTPVVTPTPTPTATEIVATPTPTPVVTPTPTPVVTPTPTPSETVGGETPTPTPVVTPTPTPSETVAGATPTATPVITPPATSTETPAGGPTQSGLLLVLLLLGMGTTGLLVFSPRRLRSR